MYISRKKTEKKSKKKNILKNSKFRIGISLAVIIVVVRISPRENKSP